MKANAYVPTIIKNCVEEILKRTWIVWTLFSANFRTDIVEIKTEGLFRVPGDKLKIAEFAKAYNEGLYPALVLSVSPSPHLS